MSGYSPTFSLQTRLSGGCLLVLAGNRHLHWAWVPKIPKVSEVSEAPKRFTVPQDLICWDTPHLTTALDLAAGRAACSALWEGVGPNVLKLKQGFQDGIIPLFSASVVPPQTAHLDGYPLVQGITLGDIPLLQAYPTLGVDRALALWAAGQLHGWPAIVIDGGTALTLSGGNERGELVGGAILPGLGLQFQSLFQHTAALPLLSLETLPDRWACNTADAILSGVAYTLLAGVQSFLQDWFNTYPHTQVCFTGGDGQWLYQHLSPWLQDPLDSSDRVTYEPHLALGGLWGITQLKLMSGQPRLIP